MLNDDTLKLDLERRSQIVLRVVGEHQVELETQQEKQASLWDDELDTAIGSLEQTLGLPSHLDRDLAWRIDDIGDTFKARFGRLGDLQDINAAVELSSHSVNLTAEWDPDHALWLVVVLTFGSPVWALFQESGGA